MVTALKQQLAEYLGDRIILVIEPRPNYRTSIKQFLANLKIRNPRFASTVADARREMLTQKVGLFIVEWKLDGTNGLQFCRDLRKEPAYSQTPFILLSTENLRQDVILASEVKVDGYLLKPFSYEDFCGQLDLVLRGHLRPNRLDSIFDLAEQALSHNDLESAEHLYDEAMTILGCSAKALTGLARIRRQRGEIDTAMGLLRQATEINPDYMDAYRMMLEISEERGNRAGIVHAASVLHDLSPENPRYTLMLARTYLEMEHFEASERYFKLTISLSPRIAEAYKGLGHVYLAQDEYEKAMRNLKKALDLDQSDISTLNSLGMTHVRLGQFKAGIQKYLLALRLDPRDPRVHFNIGQAYEKNGDLTKARWHYSQALIYRAGFQKAVRALERIDKARSGLQDLEEPEGIGLLPLRKSG